MDGTVVADGEQQVMKHVEMESIHATIVCTDDARRFHCVILIVPKEMNATVYSTGRKDQFWRQFVFWL